LVIQERDFVQRLPRSFHLFFLLSIGAQIGDECWVPMDGRDDQIGEVERELKGELGRDEAELAELQATLKRLGELRRRIAQGQLEPGDLALFQALVEEAMETM
jgi:hypothetical protein